MPHLWRDDAVQVRQDAIALLVQFVAAKQAAGAVPAPAATNGATGPSRSTLCFRRLDSANHVPAFLLLLQHPHHRVPLVCHTLLFHTVRPALQLLLLWSSPRQALGALLPNKVQRRPLRRPSPAALHIPPLLQLVQVQVQVQVPKQQGLLCRGRHGWWCRLYQRRLPV